jgi:hypothetical protein
MSKPPPVSNIERILFKTIIRREFIEDKLEALEGTKLEVMRKRLQLRKERAELHWEERKIREQIEKKVSPQ